MRNGYLPERDFQTGIGSMPVKIPKVRDRSGSGIKFNSELVPPYLRRTKSIETLLPWLYLKGISTGDFQEALTAILGAAAKGLSASTITRLKQTWEKEHRVISATDPRSGCGLLLKFGHQHAGERLDRAATLVFAKIIQDSFA